MKKDMKGIAFMVVGLNALSTAGYMLFYGWISYTTWPYEEFGFYSFNMMALLAGVVGLGIGIILFAVGAQLYLEAGRESEAMKLAYWQAPKKGYPRAGQYWYPDMQRSPYYKPPPPPPDD